VLRLLAGLGISGLALWWAFRSTDWVAFGEILSGANLWYVGLSSGILIGTIILRGYRWIMFLKPIKKVSLVHTSEATLIGYFGNNVLPFRAGEMLRAYFLGKNTGLPFSKVFGTIILERAIDAATIFFLVLLVPLVADIPEELRSETRLAIIISLALIVVLWWLSRTEGTGWVPDRFRALAGNVRLGFSSLRDRKNFLPLSVTTIIIWAAYLASFQATQAALGLGLTLGQSYSLLVVTTIVIAVPSAPGFIGTYHAAVIFMLVNVLGHELDTAQAAAVLLHAVGYVPYTILGAVIYFKSHLKFKTIMTAADMEREAS
jgi:hypothetical protein